MRYRQQGQPGRWRLRGNWTPPAKRLGERIVDDYVALALRAEERAEVADSPEIADTWRKIAETYRLLAG
jgi:hypothetical protein